jgi:hypothetical protein
MYLVMWKSLQGLNVCTQPMKCLKAISMSRTNIWNSFSKMTCMTIIAIQLENCCTNTEVEGKDQWIARIISLILHSFAFTHGALSKYAVQSSTFKSELSLHAARAQHITKFMLFPWTGKHICTFVSSWTMDILHTFCNSWHTMMEFPMVSDLWGHSAHFYSSGRKSGYSSCGRKRHCRQWKVDVSIQNKSQTADMWFFRSRFCLWLSFTIKTFCITDWTLKPQN